MAEKQITNIYDYRYTDRWGGSVVWREKAGG